MHFPIKIPLDLFNPVNTPISSTVKTKNTTILPKQILLPQVVVFCLYFHLFASTFVSLLFLLCKLDFLDLDYLLLFHVGGLFRLIIIIIIIATYHEHVLLLLLY